MESDTDPWWIDENEWKHPMIKLLQAQDNNEFSL